jgi:transcriptional/translational regulatory protein YebC/TACO1
VTKPLTETEKEDTEQLIEKFEDDEDVQKVFHGMA